MNSRARGTTQERDEIHRAWPLLEKLLVAEHNNAEMYSISVRFDPQGLKIKDAATTPGLAHQGTPAFSKAKALEVRSLCRSLNSVNAGRRSQMHQASQEHGANA